MPSKRGYPRPSDFLEDLRVVYVNEEPEGGEKTHRRRRMREALRADPATFFKIMSRHQEQYDRRLARYWAGQAKKYPATVGVVAPEPAAEAEDRGADVLEGL